MSYKERYLKYKLKYLTKVSGITMVKNEITISDMENIHNFIRNMLPPSIINGDVILRSVDGSKSMKLSEFHRDSIKKIKINRYDSGYNIYLTDKNKTIYNLIVNNTETQKLYKEMGDAWDFF